MGAILAKFRKEKTTEEILERLEERIKEIEKYTQNTQEQKKRFVGNFLAVSIGIYAFAFVIFYFVFFPPTWRDRVIYSSPLLLFPIVIIFLRRVFTWHFQRKLNKNAGQVKLLRAEKKKILEQVMDKETYKVAVNLLARFGEKPSLSLPKPSFGLTPRPTARALTPLRPLPSGIGNNNNNNNKNNNNANNTNFTITTQSPRQIQFTGNAAPVTESLSSTSLGTSVLGANISSRGSSVSLPATPGRLLTYSPQNVGGNQELRRRTPFPILSTQDRTVFERIVDVLVGDGPQDRFAMICKQCYAHNGMAVKEEFDFTTFRCAFCNALNPARKERPVAPRLSMPMKKSSDEAAENSSDDSTSSDDDDPVPDTAVPRIDLTELIALNETDNADTSRTDDADTSRTDDAETSRTNEINTNRSDNYEKDYANLLKQLNAFKPHCSEKPESNDNLESSEDFSYENAESHSENESKDIETAS